MKKLVLTVFFAAALLNTINAFATTDPTAEDLKNALTSSTKTINFREKEWSIEIKDENFFREASSNINSRKLMDLNTGQNQFTVKFWVVDTRTGSSTTVTIKHPPSCSDEVK